MEQALVFSFHCLQAPPPCRQAKEIHKYGRTLLMSQKQPLSLCLSLAQRKTDTQNQLEHPPSVSSGFLHGTLRPTVRHELSATLESSGRINEKQKGSEESQRPHNFPVLSYGSLLPRPPQQLSPQLDLQKAARHERGLKRSVSGKHRVKVGKWIKPFGFLCVSKNWIKNRS